MEARPNLIKDLTFKFSLGIIEYCEELESVRKYNLARQLFNSGTSIGANVREAQGAESKADFRHKCKIAYKEAEETEYWLSLCKHSKSYPFKPELHEEVNVILKVLGKIITTTRKVGKDE